jgi:hypothetical protein
MASLAFGEALLQHLPQPGYSRPDQRPQLERVGLLHHPVARIEVARRLVEAIWHMLTRNEAFAPAAANAGLAA